MPTNHITAPESASAVDRLSLTASSVREVTPLTGANCVCGCPCFDAEPSTGATCQYPVGCSAGEE